MLNTIIYSYNRPAQLELLIRSIKKYFVDWDTYQWNILYKYSSDFFKQGYDLVLQKHPDINYIKEENFKEDTIKLMDIRNQYLMFGVDDDVFINRFSFDSTEFRTFEQNPLIAGLYLRLNPNINFCYTENRKVTMPPMHFKDLGIHMWDWRGLSEGDISYPASIDMTLFRTKDLLSTIKSLDFSNPNYLEGR